MDRENVSLSLPLYTISRRDIPPEILVSSVARETYPLSRIGPRSRRTSTRSPKLNRKPRTNCIFFSIFSPSEKLTVVNFKKIRCACVVSFKNSKVDLFRFCRTCCRKVLDRWTGNFQPLADKFLLKKTNKVSGRFADMSFSSSCITFVRLFLISVENYLTDHTVNAPSVGGTKEYIRSEPAKIWSLFLSSSSPLTPVLVFRYVYHTLRVRVNSLLGHVGSFATDGQPKSWDSDGHQELKIFRVQRKRSKKKCIVQVLKRRRRVLNQT